MDRAEAIGALNFYRNRFYSEPLGTKERDLAEAINVVLPEYCALREQEQKKQGCEFCNVDYAVMTGSRLTRDLKHMGCDAKFCPNCGRKLDHFRDPTKMVGGAE